MKNRSTLFFHRDPVKVARELLGDLLVYEHPARGRLIGRIVETEAYRGEEDLACHASSGPTPRNAPLYGPPGRCYVYLIYGMYNMFNAVTSEEGEPAAVLIRALEPVEGLSLETDGPGKLTRAMDITRDLNNEPLNGDKITIVEDHSYPDSHIRSAPRIGVDYAGIWAELPWRFLVASSPWISKPAPGEKKLRRPKS